MEMDKDVIMANDKYGKEHDLE
ncbi:hypothetical protein A2U01_0101605, partial [Trifolium medium]|nr:hypothetical protein [Trifolium medium]